MPENTEPKEPTMGHFSEEVKWNRVNLLDVENRIAGLETIFRMLTSGASAVEDKIQQGEVFANLKLAYRHAEDARMRLGKVLQALNGGVSVYDTK